MTYKRAALQQIGQGEIQAAQPRNAIPLTYYIILIIFILFAGDVVYETYEDLGNKFTITDS
jgi:NADH:ubiquinone oxidoreductase subunit 3 (subunit A)